MCAHGAHYGGARRKRPDGFRYVTRDTYLRNVDHGIVVDVTGQIQDIVPESWAEEHLLHDDYFRDFKSCTADAWKQWSASNRSQLHAFVALVGQPKRIGSRSELEKFLTSREGSKPKEYRYKNDRFVIEDYEFPAVIMQHWMAQASANPQLWATVVKCLLLDPLGEWEDYLDVTVRQISQQGSTDTLSCGSVLPSWLMHLRSLHCLTDVHGKLRTPPELLLRTPNTESLLGIESFVEAELDDSRTRNGFSSCSACATPPLTRTNFLPASTRCQARHNRFNTCRKSHASTKRWIGLSSAVRRLN